MSDPLTLPDAPLARFIRGSARYLCSGMALICFALFLFHRLIFWIEWPPAMPQVFACLGMMFTLMGVVLTDRLRNRAGWRIVPLVLALILALFLLASRWQGT